ncbi:MAG: hypothetical protein S0880_04050 [Actinomycetota bacterium]|nr:hypothetical protein [Actinomycetota bacterium]
MDELFDLEALDEEDPFEVDHQAAHLFKHPALGIEDVLEVWQSDPIFYPAKPPAHWLMVGEVSGAILASRSLRPRRRTGVVAGRSAATSLPNISPIAVWRIDDRAEDDTR